MSKKPGLVGGAAVLGLAGLLSKLLGAAYRIPLTNLIGAEGMGLYQLVFPLYVLLLNLSSAGLPAAVSKLTAQRISGGDEPGARRLFLTAFGSLFCAGAFFSLLPLALGGVIGGIARSPYAGRLYGIIAPSVLFVALISAFRGYFQGRMNMVPTAVSQVTEQAAKAALSLYFAYRLMPDPVLAAAGVVAAVTLSELAALIVLAAMYAAHRYRQGRQYNTQANAHSTDAGNLTYAATVNDIENLADVKYISNNEKTAAEYINDIENSAAIATISDIERKPAYAFNSSAGAGESFSKINYGVQSPAAASYGVQSPAAASAATGRGGGGMFSAVVAAPAARAAGDRQMLSDLKEIYALSLPVTGAALLLPLMQLLEMLITVGVLSAGGANGALQYGLLSGPVYSIVGLPVAVCAGIATAAIPQLAGQKKTHAARSVDFALRLTAFVSLPAAALCLAFAPEISALLYGGLPAAQGARVAGLLRVCAPAIAFLPLMQTSMSVLIARGNVRTGALNLLAAVCAKLVLNVALTWGLGMGEWGAAISAGACYLIAAALNLRYIIKDTGIELLPSALKTVLCAVLAAAAGLLAAALFSRPLFRLVAGGIAAGAIYLGACAAARLFTAEQLGKVPIIGRRYR